MSVHPQYDTIIVGAGNAALCAAIRAKQLHQNVLVLEKSFREARGGNTKFSGANYRMAFSTLEEAEQLKADLDSEKRAILRDNPYTADMFSMSMLELGEHKVDKELISLLVNRSLQAGVWLKDQGVKWIVGNEATDEFTLRKWKQGPVFHIEGRGIALSDTLFKRAEQLGCTFAYGAALDKIYLNSKGEVEGLRVRSKEGFNDITAPNVILACGGFENNPEMRVRYLGEKFSSIKIRGTQANTGDGLRAAMEIGAMPGIGWANGHITPLDYHAPEFNTPEIGEASRRCRYFLGLIVNVEGQRFFNEGYDRPFVTYAATGSHILSQRNQIAFEIFDAQGQAVEFDDSYYADAEYLQADTLEKLAEELSSKYKVNKTNLLKTIAEYNLAVADNAPFEPSELDGRRTNGLSIEKTNWANKLDKPPFRAYTSSSGLTFTYAGLKINSKCQVFGVHGHIIPGLYAAGQMAAGFFHRQYPGGTGLVRGSVTGLTAAEAIKG